MNAAETLLAAGCDGHSALLCAEQQLTYRVLRRLVAQVAGAWQARGLRPGERVFVIAADSVDWVATYLGVIWAGGVAVGLDPRLPAGELQAILADSDARFVWCEDDAAAGVEAMQGLPAAVVRNGPGWAVVVAAARMMPAVRRDAEDPALWVLTPGTGGTAKAVVHVHRTVVDVHSFACGVLAADSSDRFYASSGLFSAHALGNSLFAGLRAGGTVVLDPHGPTPQRLETIVQRFRPTLVFSVPALYRGLLQAGIATRLAAAGVRRYVSVGEALPAGTRAGWREATGLAPIEGYGTSETLALVLYCDDETGLLRPTPLTQTSCVPGPQGSVPQRIWMRHGAVARGYWHRPEAEADAFRPGGWFSPGDLFLSHPHDRLEWASRDGAIRGVGAARRRGASLAATPVAAVGALGGCAGGDGDARLAGWG
jgi:acyl-CoA synthetase (AMP-forming)/AMP-acid ligase II